MSDNATFSKKRKSATLFIIPDCVQFLFAGRKRHAVRGPPCLRAKMIQKRAFYARNQGVGCSQPRGIVSSFLKISFVMPLILFWIRVPASAMSLNLALSLRGIANFPKYSIAHIRLQTARRHNINRTTERFFKQLFDGDQIKETAVVRKLDEAIDIRIGS